MAAIFSRWPPLSEKSLSKNELGGHEGTKSCKYALFYVPYQDKNIKHLKIQDVGHSFQVGGHFSKMAANKQQNFMSQ